MLVGTKCDLRDDKKTLDQLKARHARVVTFEEGQKVAQQMGAQYVECSALTQRGLNTCFNTVIRTVIGDEKEKSKKKNKKGLGKDKCSIL